MSSSGMLVLMKDFQILTKGFNRCMFKRKKAIFEIQSHTKNKFTWYLVSNTQATLINDLYKLGVS